MNILSGESLSETLIRCFEKPKYSVGVIFNNRVRLEEFLSELWDQTMGVICSKNTIRFNNGSFIKAIIGNDPYIKGDRFNELLFDDCTPGESERPFNQKVLSNSYSVSEEYPDDEIDTSAIDEFLSSFKINTQSAMRDE